jgi:hypothetical protein
MSQIATMTTGAGVVTTVNLQYCPAYVTIGTPGTPLPLQGFSVSVAGKETINVTVTDFIRAFSLWLVESPNQDAAILMSVLKLANGNLPNQQTQLRFTNDGVTTPAVFAFSESIGDDVVIGATSSVNANANQLVTDFDFLAIDETNFDNADVTFRSGFTDRFTASELRNFLAMSGQTGSTGRLSGTLAVNNITRSIVSIRLFATAGGNMPYFTAKIPMS